MSTLTRLRNDLNNIIGSLPPSPRPVPKSDLDAIVSKYLDNGLGLRKKSEWDNIFREQIFTIALDEGQALQNPESTYYQDLTDRLDILLTFSEFNACDSQLPLGVVEDLLETQTVASCMHIFTWLELRYDRIIVDMHPNKGKGLTLLRTLNDLLRRIPKTGDATKFCGRILIFLSSVFPFGERSGVNLRGEYGPAWVPVTVPTPGDEKSDQSMADPSAMQGVESTSASQEDSKKQLPEKSEEEKKIEFYNTFWGLQTFFARPNLFAEPPALSQFKTAVTSVLNVLMEATKKEQAMMGIGHRSGTVGSTAIPTGPGGSAAKRKRAEMEGTNQNPETSASQEYFFAKFLTSSDLLDFELSDALFRRQILVQLLILIRHLLTFTQKEKAAWATPRNRTLQMEFTLSESDEKWMKELWSKTTLELRNTTPDGRAFASTISVILDRDRNWVRWKNDLCPPIGKLSAIKDVDMAGDAGSAAEKEWRKVFGPFIHDTENERPVPYGSGDLADVWTMGYRELSDLENPGDIGDVKDFLKQIKREELLRDNLRKRKGLPALPPPHKFTSTIISPAPRHPTPGIAAGDANMTQRSASPQRSAATPGVAAEMKRSETPVRNTISLDITALEPNEDLEEYNLKKQSLTWRALRLAIRQGHLHLFGRIEAGDINILVQEINKPPRPRPGVGAPINAATAFASSTPTTPLIVPAPSAHLASGEVPVDANGDLPPIETNGAEIQTAGDVAMSVD